MRSAHQMSPAEKLTGDDPRVAPSLVGNAGQPRQQQEAQIVEVGDRLGPDRAFYSHDMRPWGGYSRHHLLQRPKTFAGLPAYDVARLSQTRASATVCSWQLASLQSAPSSAQHA